MVNNANILLATYDSLGTILRLEKVKDPITGVTSTKLVKIADNVKLALSKVDNQVMNVDGIGKLAFTHKVFTTPNIDIREGDTLEINGKEIYIASRPFIYPNSHQEVIVSFKEYS